jgi:coenzyme PQQ precursor peptide PqqA
MRSPRDRANAPRLSAIPHPAATRAEHAPSAHLLQKGGRPYGNPARTFIPMLKETFMQWSQPAFEDLRFGFEITMYISNR